MLYVSCFVQLCISLSVGVKSSREPCVVMFFWSLDFFCIIMIWSEMRCKEKTNKSICKKSIRNSYVQVLVRLLHTIPLPYHNIFYSLQLSPLSRRRDTRRNSNKSNKEGWRGRNKNRVGVYIFSNFQTTKQTNN